MGSHRRKESGNDCRRTPCQRRSDVRESRLTTLDLNLSDWHIHIPPWNWGIWYRPLTKPELEKAGIDVPQEFVRRAGAGRRPEKRLRFAEACVESGCGHWIGQQCAVVERMLELQAGELLPAANDQLPHCTIRSHCRWFAQRGRAACGVCRYVVTDLTDDWWKAC
jgi:hypothetical protein